MTPSLEIAPIEECKPDSELTLLRALSQEHHELDLRLEERKKALNLHLSMLSDLPELPQKSQNFQLLDQLYSAEQSIHDMYSTELLNTQIALQDYLEIKGILSNYQTRVSQMRSNLIDKEAEVSFETYERRKDALVKRENIRIYSLELADQCELRKTLKQVKKMQVEIAAMEFVYKQKTVSKQFELMNGLNSSNEFTFVKLPMPSKSRLDSEATACFDRRLSLQNFLPDCKDKLFQKACELLVQETAAEVKLREQYEKLKIEAIASKKEHAKLVSKYKEAQKERIGKVRELILTAPLLSELKSEVTEGTRSQNSDARCESSILRSSKSIEDMTEKDILQVATNLQQSDLSSKIENMMLSPSKRDAVQMSSENVEPKMNYKNYQKNKRNKKGAAAG